MVFLEKLLLRAHRLQEQFCSFRQQAQRSLETGRIRCCFLRPTASPDKRLCSYDETVSISSNEREHIVLESNQDASQLWMLPFRFRLCHPAYLLAHGCQQIPIDRDLLSQHLHHLIGVFNLNIMPALTGFTLSPHRSFCGQACVLFWYFKQLLWKEFHRLRRYGDLAGQGTFTR